MTKILVFTGSVGPDIAIAAAASAVHAASQGRRTLLLSLRSAASLGALLGASVGAAPAAIAPNLQALALDVPGDLATVWEQNRARLPAPLGQIAGDELPLLPGLEMLFGLLRLRDLASRYDLVALDAGPHDLLLRALGLPDGLRWVVRQLFGLDRGPGRSSASVARAALPTSLLPADALGSIQDMRVQAEQLRGLLNAPSAAARYVLRPDLAAMEEARLAIPAMQLHGLAVSALIGGPLLPQGLEQTPLAALADAQAAILAQVVAEWPNRPVVRLPLHAGTPDLAALGGLGAGLAGDASVELVPIAETWQGEPAIAIELPGLPKNALQLALSGDELIVRIGAYRRHLLLPERLRGGAIRATREGEYLIVRKRV
ncbi:MAG TPA: ArsA-related P-loop ATPase [Roseiflexaceae bacterium]|nr:ArsA-related P-loop ATPase [Roseiflexaceae bacterium]